MADILYTYKNQVYANITNQCNCRCTFCIRSHEDGVGDAETLWHKKDPTVDEIKQAMDSFDFTGFQELVFCGYGEPTCALDTLIEVARYAKETFGLAIRVNTNGLANLQYGENIVPRLAKVIDTISISLNAPDAEAYSKVSRPRFDHAFEGLLDFTAKCKELIPHVKLTVVDVLAPEDIKASQELARVAGRRFTDPEIFLESGTAC